eukprot:TRINITY_DN15757_c0_g3_i1.p1 TRINITY_DN15757_c0_g3~~TRINITY_DN15757_c0_g3_i1.p1  ORF type:complete len:172 (+),score=16.40 TRINITY_DN15757_c0_g3_i1:239-754(+)
MEKENYLCVDEISKPFDALEVYYKTYSEIANSLGLDAEKYVTSLLPILEDPSNEDFDSLNQEVPTIENLLESTANNIEKTSPSRNCIEIECDDEIPDERLQSSADIYIISISNFLNAKKGKAEIPEVKERIIGTPRKKHREARKSFKDIKRNWITHIISNRNIQNCNCTIL